MSSAVAARSESPSRRRGRHHSELYRRARNLLSGSNSSVPPGLWVEGPGFPLGYFVGTRCHGNATVGGRPACPPPTAAAAAPLADSTRRPTCGDECVLWMEGRFPAFPVSRAAEGGDAGGVAAATLPPISASHALSSSAVPPATGCSGEDLEAAIAAAERRAGGGGNATGAAAAREGIGGGASGRFRLDSGLWEFPGRCQLHYFTPAEAFALLAGRALVFAGDSMVRQLFLRLVALLRGTPVAQDRVFHGDAVYLRNATHDYLYVQLRFGEAFRPEAILRPSVNVSFFWQVRWSTRWQPASALCSEVPRTAQTGCGASTALV